MIQSFMSSRLAPPCLYIGLIIGQWFTMGLSQGISIGKDLLSRFDSLNPAIWFKKYAADKSVDRFMPGMTWLF